MLGAAGYATVLVVLVVLVESGVSTPGVDTSSSSLGDVGTLISSGVLFIIVSPLGSPEEVGLMDDVPVFSPFQEANETALPEGFGSSFLGVDLARFSGGRGVGGEAGPAIAGGPAAKGNKADAMAPEDT